MHGRVMRGGVKSTGMIGRVISSTNDGLGGVCGPHLFPDEVRDVHGRLGRQGAVGRLDRDLKQIGFGS